MSTVQLFEKASEESERGEAAGEVLGASAAVRRGNLWTSCIDSWATGGDTLGRSMRVCSGMATGVLQLSRARGGPPEIISNAYDDACTLVKLLVESLPQLATVGSAITFTRAITILETCMCVVSREKQAHVGARQMLLKVSTRPVLDAPYMTVHDNAHIHASQSAIVTRLA